jgi:hypothetical protein
MNFMHAVDVGSGTKEVGTRLTIWSTNCCAADMRSISTTPSRAQSLRFSRG